MLFLGTSFLYSVDKKLRLEIARKVSHAILIYPLDEDDADGI